MSAKRKFTAIKSAVSTYYVGDDPDNPEFTVIGRVAKVGYVLSGPWIADYRQSGPMTNGPHVTFRTRHEAGEALSEAVRSGNYALIYGDKYNAY